MLQCRMWVQCVLVTEFPFVTAFFRSALSHSRGPQIHLNYTFWSCRSFLIWRWPSTVEGKKDFTLISSGLCPEGQEVATLPLENLIGTPLLLLNTTHDCDGWVDNRFEMSQRGERCGPTEKSNQMKVMLYFFEEPEVISSTPSSLPYWIIQVIIQISGCYID